MSTFLLLLFIVSSKAVINHQTKSPPPGMGIFKTQCGNGPALAASLNNKFYYAPTPGSTDEIFLVFNSNSYAWNNITIPSTTNVFPYIKECAISAVTAQNGDNYLVIGGGESTSDKTTPQIHAYNIDTGNWTVGQNMETPSWNLCSAAMDGSVFFATGDLTSTNKHGHGIQSPEERRIQRFNLTTMTIDAANNMEKERSGAGCAAHIGAGRLFWAGGEDPVVTSITDQIEIWLPSLVRVKFVWKLSEGKKYIGSTTCGDYVIFAGGKDLSDNVFNTIDMYNASGNATTEHFKFTLPQPVWYPSLACVDEEYVLFAGGYTNHEGTACSDKVSVLDLANIPAKGSQLPLLNYTLNATAIYASGSTHGDSIMFFDGTVGDIFRND